MVPWFAMWLWCTYNGSSTDGFPPSELLKWNSFLDGVNLRCFITSSLTDLGIPHHGSRIDAVYELICCSFLLFWFLNFVLSDYKRAIMFCLVMHSVNYWPLKCLMAEIFAKCSWNFKWEPLGQINKKGFLKYLQFLLSLFKIKKFCKRI